MGISIIAYMLLTLLLLQAPEDMENVFDLPKRVPPSIRTEEMEYPNSGSDWEGMDDGKRSAYDEVRFYTVVIPRTRPHKWP